MSKIGKISISIPEKVKVVLAGNMLNIEGPLGKKSLDIDLDTFNLEIKEGKAISIKPKKIDQNTKRLWGMNRSLLNNAIIGASKGYEKTLELVGVGYRAALKGKQLNLQLGFSHDINFDIHTILNNVNILVHVNVNDYNINNQNNIDNFSAISNYFITNNNSIYNSWQIDVVNIDLHKRVNNINHIISFRNSDES